MMPSPPFLISLAVSAGLGAIGGSAFLWAPPQRAWELLTAAFLWSLIGSAGTTIGRFHGERLRRGAWRRGLALALAQSFPLTTAFLAVATLPAAGAGVALPAAAAPGLYLATSLLALAIGLMGVLGSPFR